MVENRPILNVVTHLVLILGIAMVALADLDYLCGGNPR